MSVWCDWGQCCTWCAMGRARVASNDKRRAALCTQLILLAMFTQYILGRPVLVAALSKARSAATRLLRLGVRVPPRADDCLLRVLCVVRWRSLRQADYSSREVQPTVARPCV